ncbi:MAG: hypothetical protein J6X99_07040 [Bacteroidales bacterium]|nr:hypothetical protein [Bacteroidales bacterium]
MTKITPPHAAYLAPNAIAVKLEHEQLICASGSATLKDMGANSVYDEDFEDD